MFLYQLINVYYSYKLSNYVVINSNTYKIRIPVVYSLVVYFLHVEIHSMKLKKDLQLCTLFGVNKNGFT